jgi:DNA repair protein RadC
MICETIYKEEIPERIVINGADDVYHLIKKYADSRQEQCIVLTLNSEYNLIGIHLVHIGTADLTPECARDIFYHAIMDNATKICVCHNHPSGSVGPSKSDLKTATALCKIGLLHAIEVLVNIIFSKYGYTSVRPSEKEIDAFKKELYS